MTFYCVLSSNISKKENRGLEWLEENLYTYGTTSQLKNDYNTENYWWFAAIFTPHRVRMQNGTAKLESPVELLTIINMALPQGITILLFVFLQKRWNHATQKPIHRCVDRLYSSFSMLWKQWRYGSVAMCSNDGILSFIKEWQIYENKWTCKKISLGNVRIGD